MVIQRTLPVAAPALAPIDVDERYEERVAAGRQLAKLLLAYRGGRALVLALPPGGVVVAGEIARALRLQLDVMVARELFVRSYPGVAVGGLSEGGGLCLNRSALRLPGLPLAMVWREARDTQHDLAALIEVYRHGRRLPMLYRRPVILVDDGLGTGLMQLAALQALRRAHAQRCIVATPAGTADAIDRVGRQADELVALADETSAALHGRSPLLPWLHTPDDDEAAVLLEQWRMPRPADE